MRVQVITSCTGEKAVRHERQLTLEDFRKGAEHVAARERELAEFLTPAESLYTGLQHVRLMHGARAFRERRPEVELDLWIVSAGYGMVRGDRKLAPYEATFATMGKRQIREWAEGLGIPADFRRVLAESYDLTLVLLGKRYLTACAFDASVSLSGPTIVLGSRSTFSGLTLESSFRLRLECLSVVDARHFSCGLVGLKGEVAARVLACLADHPGLLARVIEIDLHSLPPLQARTPAAT